MTIRSLDLGRRSAACQTLDSRRSNGHGHFPATRPLRSQPSTRFWRSLLAIPVCVSLLAGCGEEQQTMLTGDGEANTLTFSFPLDGQAAVPTSTPLILRFNHTLDEDAVDDLTLTSAHGPVPLELVRLTEDRQGIVFKPEAALSYSTPYTLDNPSGALFEPEIRFTTAPASDGLPIDQTEGTGAFQILRRIPDGSANRPVTDFSALRLQLSEPVAPASVRYGDTISLLDASGNLVAAQVLVQDQRITVDPLAPLESGGQYRLDITDGVKSRIVGTALEIPAEGWQFVASDTHPRGLLAQSTRDSNGGRQRSDLSGLGYNSVGLSSLLLGDDTATEASGSVFAELGYLPRFEGSGQSIPLRISRNSLMQGSHLNVVVAGALPAGFGSGSIDVRFLTDANGFMHPNPYSDLTSAPRVIELYLDLALSTENPVANGAFAQQLLHVQLVGTTMVEDGRMVIDAYGVIEPEVLGLDRASGQISFRLEGYANQAAEPKPEEFGDTIEPGIRSWVPGTDTQDTIQPGDPLVVFFTEPMLTTSLHEPGNVVLFSDIDGAGSQRAMDIELVSNGSALKIVPAEPLQRNVNYTLTLNNLTDLAGNPLLPTTLPFALTGTDIWAATDQAPWPLTTLPGYPCAKTAPSLPAHQGQCAGGKASEDQLPVPSHASDKPLLVRFSQDMDPSTFIAGDTVRVEIQRDGLWESLPSSDYLLHLTPRSLEIVPVAGWESGALHRYTLASNVSNAGSIIRSLTGNPLQTQVLTQGTRALAQRNFGGPDLINHFIATEVENQLALPLRNLPATDVNGNLNYDLGHEPGSETGESLPNAIGMQVANVSSLGSRTSVVEAGRVGCWVPGWCPQSQYLYLTAGLDAIIHGTPNEQGQLDVDILPTILSTSGADLWVQIDTSFIDLFPDVILDVDLSQHERIPTGPLFMRIRYHEDEAGNPIPARGSLYNDDSGQLMFSTTLDVYLDAPYLNPSLGPANLTHNLRGYELNDLVITGPVTFLEDGRMQITLSNEEAISINADVWGTIEINGETTGGLCGLWPFTYICGGIANVAVSADTRLQLEIPPGSLRLNYLSPITQ
ncbi:Ig-like domain-containing protein [Marinobacter sp. SS21]|uniref:Ig-like domain-containing protein n=1 Tax=Marinobacter sp. SS21 TaxID=2979460 RepID=UPI00232DDC13|nr:Ig-like domain-containing protein [Marinobacter sp. SS21]MDC0661477.1 Ig-like domain-containing protein [Marinobacter sp. SS21]